MSVYEILAKKRAGEALAREEMAEIVAGAATEKWGDAELSAFLMAAAIRGLDPTETANLTELMLDSGDRWKLYESVPGLVDKHSTGGVGDKVSLILSPMLAVCDVPVVMLTGRSLGHTGGTADKLESIPGLELGLDRDRCLELLEQLGMAIGIATEGIAPADRKLYSLRDRTATVSSIPLVIGSIVSKKLAAGPEAIVYDVKTGSGAFFPEIDQARELASRLCSTTKALGCEASALLTDMSQPLGHWVGHTAEVMESVEVLRGGGSERLRTLCVELSAEAARLGGHAVSPRDLESALDSGAAYERFLQWAESQGAHSQWLADHDFTLAPIELIARAERDGMLQSVDNRGVGLLLSDLCRASGSIDPSISIRYESLIGNQVGRGDALARLFVSDEFGSRKPELEQRLANCFRVGDAASAPLLVSERFPHSEPPEL